MMQHYYVLYTYMVNTNQKILNTLRQSVQKVLNTLPQLNSNTDTATTTATTATTTATTTSIDTATDTTAKNGSM